MSLDDMGRGGAEISKMNFFPQNRQGYLQAIAQSDCAIYYNKLRYLLFKIIVELQPFECNMRYLLMKITVLRYLLLENRNLL